MYSIVYLAFILKTLDDFIEKNTANKKLVGTGHRLKMYFKNCFED
jgi:hypothetical protein